MGYQRNGGDLGLIPHFAEGKDARRNEDGFHYILAGDFKLTTLPLRLWEGGWSIVLPSIGTAYAMPWPAIVLT